MFCLVLVLIVCVAGRVPDRNLLSSPGLLNAEFLTFQKKQGRNYRPTEQRYRLRVFRDNLRRIISCNDRQDTYSCEENLFTDLTEEEKEAYTGLRNVTYNADHGDDGDVTSRMQVVSRAAESYDWRDHGAVTAVKNQGGCGSCWTFSAIGAVEGAYKIATNVLKTFSEQELLDCTYEEMWPGYDGCNGGWYYDAWSYVKNKNRLAREVNYPYKASDGVCSMQYVTNDLGVAKLASYVEVKDKSDDGLAGAIAISPVSVAMLSRGNFFDYKQGIYNGDGDCQCNWSPNHALTAVAYASDSFVIKNSWGGSWGDNGFIKIARNLRNTVCRAADFAYYPIFETDGVEPTLVPTDAPVTSQEGPTDNDGCPKGTTRCPDGTCKHIHMC